MDQGGRFKINNGILKIYSPTGQFTSTHLPHSNSDQMAYRNVIKDLRRICLGDHWLIEQWEKTYRPTPKKKSPVNDTSSIREHFVQEHNVTHDDIVDFADDDLNELHTTYPECNFKMQGKAQWKTISSFQKHAPYGIPKEKGGDSPKNVERMERCVNKLMEEGHDKSSAIAICKSNLGFTKDKTKKKSSWKSVTAHWDPDDDDDDDINDNWDIDEDDWLDDEDEPSIPSVPSTPTVINPSGYNEKDDPLVAFINASTLLSDQEVELIQKACQKQVDDDFGPSWHLGMRSIFVKKGDIVPYDAWQIMFLDKPTISGALGYHDFVNGQPIGYIFITTSQQAGVSPSSVASHEILEMLGDPLINTTAQVGNQTFYALESCDAVQQSSYTVNVTLNNVNYPIEVSNFVTPDWFRAQTNGPWDFLRKLNGPLELLPNGSYIGVWTPRTGWVQKNAFGEIKPIDEEDKRYLGDDEKGTVVHHAPQEPQRCLRPFQRRQMDKPFEVTSSWKMIANHIVTKKKDVLEGGDCYQVAGEYFMDNAHKIPEMRLVHGTVTSNKKLGDFGHAWIEIGDVVIDNSNLPIDQIGQDRIFRKEWYYQKGKIKDTVNYNFQEMRKHALKTGHWGPWHSTTARHSSKLIIPNYFLGILQKISWKSVMAMPTDETFLNDIIFDHSNTNSDHTLKAYHPSFEDYIGHITWNKKNGEVVSLAVDPQNRRKGLATLLWNRAREIDPNIKHSIFLTESGFDWLKSLKDEESESVLENWDEINDSKEASVKTSAHIAKKLWLDDARPAPDGWDHFKTAADAIRALEQGEYTHISLDHDLGPQEAGTGYDVVKWLEEKAFTDDKFVMPKWKVHSANPVGRDKMERVLRNIDLRKLI